MTPSAGNSSTTAGSGGGGAAATAGMSGVAGSATSSGASTGGASSNLGGGGATEAGGPSNAGAGGEFPAADKLVVLTFDDGPNTTATGLVLDRLEAHQVPASFFLIGQNVGASSQAVLQRAAGLGCTFENHSYGYDALTGTAEADILSSVGDTSAAVEQFTGAAPQFFRPPNLATDAALYAAVELPFVGGIVAGDFPEDYGGNPTVDAVSQKIRDNVQDGSIIVLHDVQPELDPHPTPDVLDIIIPELKQQGYEFVTLPDLFRRRNVDLTVAEDKLWESVPPAK